MTQTDNNQTEELRHERKFLIVNYASSEVEQIIKYHPACFKELYQIRQVNNIYFDNLSFNSYYANVEGDTNRTKTRIRWYGNLFGKVEGATLEFKIKRGLLGKKNLYPVSSFDMDEHFSKQQIINAVNTEKIPEYVRHSLLSMQPVLMNSYLRKYFISEDKKFRVTIDRNLTYYHISYFKNTFLNQVKDNISVVVELKYASEFELEAKSVCTALPFMITKNSKYLSGIERVLF